MNKIYRTFALALVLLSSTSSFSQPFMRDAAEETTGAFIKNRQEITISYGYYTHEQVLMSIPENYHTDVRDYQENTVFFTEAEKVFNVPWSQPVYFNDMKRSGAVFINYVFYPPLNKILAVSIGAGYERETADLTTATSVSNNTRIRIGGYQRKIYTIAPEIWAYYSNNKLVNFYGLLGLGRSFYSESLTNDATGKKEVFKGGYWMFQFSPIGIKIGKTFSGFLEVGYGYKGALRAGAAYRF